MNTWEMAIEELTDAVVFKRAAVLAPSQAEAILLVLRRAEAAGVSNVTPLTIGSQRTPRVADSK